jgi:hypothetical protein
MNLSEEIQKIIGNVIKNFIHEIYTYIQAKNISSEITTEVLE